ncbi:glycosyltransferase family 2 protein [Chitinophaga lutea]
MPLQPTITIILPVYNGAAFLAPAIQSMLDQTFGDFELLIVNDGSTDNSQEIIDSFRDERIRAIVQPNRGLVAALNRGVQEARGRYIARMDADDVSLPERLAKQVEYMEAHPETVVLSTVVDLIDEQGNLRGTWAQDKKYVTREQIRHILPYLNCLTHSNILARREVMQQYPYRPEQKHIEDYDLWLRMLSDGLIIEKLPDVLLYVRVHQTSVTMDVKRNNIFFKHLACKRRYLAARIGSGKFNGFDARVILGMGLDLATGVGKWLKQL